jgi:hypothetical protein
MIRRQIKDRTKSESEYRCQYRFQSWYIFRRSMKQIVWIFKIVDLALDDIESGRIAQLLK